MVQVVSPQKSMTAECSQCKAELSYVYTEIQQKIERDYGGGHERVKFIVCPCCNNQVRLQ